MEINTKLTAWAEEERPREKLIQFGARHLTNAELLAILLGNGTKGLNVVDLSRHILQEVNNNLNHLSRLELNDIKKFKGIGKAKAITILAALEFGRRQQTPSIDERPKILSSSDAYQILAPHLRDLSSEEFWVLYMNRANRVVSKSMVSQGGISGTVVDVRIIFKKALDCKATCMIIAHNHPSGQLRPSQADISITKKIKEGGKILDVRVFDHIIVTASGYYSFSDEGIL